MTLKSLLEGGSEDVARRAYGEARRKRASPLRLKALVESGIVENHFTHGTGSDRDSTGFLQQRPSQGWGPVGESVETDTDQFLRAADKIIAKGFKGTAGELAAQVQRPAAAYRGRYQQNSGLADKIIASLGGAGGSSGAPGGSGGGMVQSGLPDAQAPSTGVEQQARPVIATAGIQPPAFTPQVTLPKAFKPVDSSGGPMSVPGTAGPGQPMAQAARFDSPSTTPASQSDEGVSVGSGEVGAQSAVAFAKSRLGHYKETTGFNRGPELDRLQARFGTKGAAWCAIFTSVAVTQGGAPMSARTTAVREVRDQAQSGKKGYVKGFQKHAQPGDLILFNNDHIAMVESVDRHGRLHLIDGNNSKNMVARRVVAPGAGDIVRPKYGRR